MRRFSQRSALVTLSEINITPLLDLAFVLLIIFIITTPLLEQGLNLKPPTGGGPDKRVEARDVRTVEVSLQGTYLLNKQRMSLDQIEANLVKDSALNPNLVVYIRGDEMGHWKDIFAVMDFCNLHGIKMSLRGQPPKPR
jgi:biopolymer transport protein ExbD